MANRAKFSSRLGIIAATVGSAVGLVNVWRFPAEVQAGGGAAFLLVYVICIFLLGIPVMVSEMALGRGGESDAVGAFRRITPGKHAWKYVGILAVLSSYFILSFYMVVSGWTFEYLINSITGDLYSSTSVQPGSEAAFAERMGSYISGTWRPISMTLVMIVANLLVLLKGVQGGIEKMSNIMMPLLFVLLLMFCVVSLSLPGASAGLEFFLSPDLSRLTPRVIIDALGQSFFSLSLAMGITVTYASYYPSSTRLGRTAFTVAMLDLLVALLMGVIIFPAVMTFGLGDADLAGSSLVFVTLPEIFAQMGATRLWSSLFFLLLTVAAFTSTVSLAEVSVALTQRRFNMSRRGACLAVILPLLVLSPICSLSVGPWSGYKFFGMTFFDFLDNLTTNFMLPIGGILLCVYVGWVAPKSFFERQLTNGGTLHSGFLGIIHFIVKWIAPILMTVILLGGLAD